MGNELKVQNSLVVAGPAIISGSLTTIGGLAASGSFNVTGSLNVTGSGFILNPINNTAGLNIVSSQTGAGSLVLSTIGTPGINNGAYLILRHADGTFPTPSSTDGVRIISTQDSQYFNGTSYIASTKIVDISEGQKIFGVTPSFGGTLTYYGKLSKGNWYFGDLSSTLNTARDTSVNARVQIKGSGATSSTTALRIENANASGSMVVLDDGFVGIGTTTPSTKLHVSGAVGNGIILDGVGSVGMLIQAGGLAGGSGTVQLFAGNNNNSYLRLASEYIREGAGGGLGVNVSRENITAKFQVRGSGATSSTTALLVQNANASSSLQVRDDGVLLNYVSGSTYPALETYVDGLFSGIKLTRQSDGFIGRIQWNSQYQLPDNGGNIVIGATTAGFTHSGGLATLRTGEPRLAFNSNSNSGKGFYIIAPTASNSFELYLHDNYNQENIRRVAGFSNTNDFTLYQSGSQNALFFVSGSGNVGIGTSTPAASLHISGSSGSVLLEVDSNSQQNILYVSGSGRVGIGTSTPSYNLEVSSTGYTSLGIMSGASINAEINFQNRGYALPRWTIRATGAADGSSGNLTFQRLANTFPFAITSGDNILVGVGTDIGARLGVRGAGATSSTTALLVQNSNASASLAVLDNGNVGIGTASPTTPLTINKPGSNNFFNFEPSSTGTPPYLQAFYQGAVDARIYFDNSFKFRSGGSTIPYAIDAGAIQGTSLVSAGSAGSQGSLLLVGSSGNASAVYFWESGVSYRGALGFSGSSADFQIITNLPGPTSFSGNERFRIFGATGNVAIGTSTDVGFKLDVSGSGRFTNNLTVTGSFTVVTGSSIKFQVNQTGVKIGNASTDSHSITGSIAISSSASTSSAALTIYKSGSSVLDIQGSQGQLFSVVDTLSGSLMSVNDVSGLPILEVFSDDRVVLGTYGAPALVITGSNAVFTGSVVIDGAFLDTVRTGSLGVGSTLIYTVNTGSYQAGFFDYYINSGSNFRAGNIMAVFGAGTYRFTDAATPDIGNTTNLQFSMSMAGASAQLFASASTAGWTVKTTFRTI